MGNLKRIGVPMTKTPVKSDGNVPCTSIGCNKCCYLPEIVLHPEMGDDVKALGAKMVIMEGGKVAWLMPRRSGHCVYLYDGACTIYNHRPSTCRAFDCRTVIVNFTRAERHMITQGKKEWKHVLDAAKRLQGDPGTRLVPASDEA